MKTPSVCALAASILLAGCAAGPERAPVAAPADTGLPLGELPPQRLDKGQCALFLWSRTEPAQRVFMGLSSPALARVRLGGRTVDLPRADFDGEAAFGHHPEQTYAGGGVTLSAQVEIATRGALVGGAVVPAGTLTYQDARGESTVMPVAGLVACQP